MRGAYKKWLFGSLASTSLVSAAYAVTSNFSMAALIFSEPFTITETLSMNFGNLMANTASTYTLSTANAITATGGGAAVGGVQRAGSYTIADTAGSANIDIATAGLTANNGVTPQNPVCSYDGGPDIAGCAINNAANPGVAGKVLKVGIQLVVDGSQANGGSATPQFGIDVTYH